MLAVAVLRLREEVAALEQLARVIAVLAHVLDTALRSDSGRPLVILVQLCLHNFEVTEVVYLVRLEPDVLHLEHGHVKRSGPILVMMETTLQVSGWTLCSTCKTT